MSGIEAGKRVTHQMMFNERAFNITLRAISKLSQKHRKYETLASLVTHVCETYEIVPPSVLEDLRSVGPVSGDLKVFLRIPNVAQACFERFRAVVANSIGPTYRVPEVVILCCLIISPSETHLPEVGISSMQ